MATKTSAPRRRKRKSNVVELVEIRNERRAEEARQVRADLHERVDAIADKMADDFSGYAIVLWTRTGDTVSCYSADFGTVSPDLVPTLAHDALNRHVAVELAIEEQQEDGGGGTG